MVMGHLLAANSRHIPSRMGVLYSIEPCMIVQQLSGVRVDCTKLRQATESVSTSSFVAASKIEGTVCDVTAHCPV